MTVIKKMAGAHMKFLSGLGLVLCLALSCLDVATAADAPPVPMGPFETLAYIEVAPSKTKDAIAALKDYRDAARKEPNVTMADVYQQESAPSRFLTHDIWKDYDAYKAHAMAASTATLMEKLKPIQFGPPDVRPHSVVSSAGDGRTGAVVIVSHLDVIPPDVAKLLAILQPLIDGSAKDRGMLRFEILRQGPDHNNHFRLWEIWASEKDWEAHNMTKHAQDYRNAISPLLGTPYDQIKYKVLN